MAPQARNLILVMCVVGEFIGLAIFLKGFFPHKTAIPGHASFRNLPPEPSASADSWKRRDDDSASFVDDVLQAGVELTEEDEGYNDNVEIAPPIHPTFGKVVIMLIDGLRADFVLGDRGPDLMPYTRGLIDKRETKSFVARAHVPTVTMPRIKGITTGTVPAYIDFVVNLDSKATQEDNIILQMYLSQKRIHLYGDDTWIRMFPHLFSKTDGTTSFYVTDYTEVDNNVTRNIEPTLRSTDWDAIILHYLGLDHIGHLGGPYSPLVRPKMREMDSIVQKIHQSLLQHDKEGSLPSLLVICGDHGMSEAGSHGGASEGEVLTPLIFISSAYSGAKGLAVSKTEIQQIDFAPTFSLLLGHPIPQNSLGCAIPQALNGSLAMRDQLRALQLNGYQLMAVHDKNTGNANDDAKLQLMQAVRLHSRWLSAESTLTTQTHISLGEKALDQYTKALHTMRDRITSSLSQYDMHAMGCGMILLSMVVLILLLEMASTQASRPSSHLTHATAVFVVCCLATTIIQVGMCGGLGGANRDVLCSQSSSSFILMSLFVLTLGFCAAALICTPPVIYTQLYNMCKNPTQSLTEISLIIGTLLHTYSLASSSFVEEEHQTWYFNTMSLMLGVCLSGLVSCSGRLACAAFLSACLMRVLRAWNQTGVEWINQPDIGDFLVKPENKSYLSFVLLISLIQIYVTTVRERKRHQPLMVAAFLGIILYRNATRAIGLPFSVPSSPKGILEAWFTYGIILASLLVTAIRCLLTYRRNLQEGQSFLNMNGSTKRDTESPTVSITSIILEDLHSALLMLVTLILRPHNSAVVAIATMLQYGIHSHILPRLHWKVWVVTLVHVWMGQAAFYAQGNSNNAATMDISAGYVGLDGYNLILAAGLTFVATYAGPLLWLNRLAIYITYSYRDPSSSAVEESCYTLALSRALPIAAYTMLATLQRYHLFVWSVFSPKLLYDGVHTSLICGVILLSQVHFVFRGLLESLGFLRRNRFKDDLHSR